jgi:hypothetical protein
MIQIMVEYDNKTLLPLLVVAFHFLNPIIYGMTEVTLVDNDSIFGALISNVATVHGLLKNELGLFYHSHVKLKDDVLPLAWWKFHETWFPSVSFVV